ncbi:hypothetical protein M5V91_10940 [Cytobacillus pseudoceanisediminis]|uniref:hypothetical protein n=1 Tax=Cytobacillus pseudoceanisediminis TaxID=3051614 RepID=UPI0021857B1F|nr:hypothetical protein [Cytobacillus pseudoceanisediminis]UQX56094.1 hypothetical protein M5V91_10940 [Cytobacillus pseudoceanisediminis]
MNPDNLDNIDEAELEDILTEIRQLCYTIKHNPNFRFTDDQREMSNWIDQIIRERNLI